MQFPDSWDSRFILLLRAFNENDVEYLLIGSMAKSHYDQQPSVGDMDLLINPTPENARRVKSAFRDRNYHHLLQYDLEKLAFPGKQIRISDCGHVGDVLTPKPGFDFCKAFSCSIDIEVDGIPVRIASKRELETLDSMRERSESAGCDWSN